MKLVAHEAQELRELALSCCNSITNMAYYRQHAKDPELKAMIERHFPFHIQDYSQRWKQVTLKLGSFLRMHSGCRAGMRTTYGNGWLRKGTIL